MPMFLLKYWKHMIIVAAIAAIVFREIHRTNQIEDLTQENVELRAELILKDSMHEVNRAKMQGEIDDQNTKIQTANTKYAQLEQSIASKVDTATASLDARNRGLEQQLALLRSVEQPKTCVEAIDFIVKLAGANKWPTSK